MTDFPDEDANDEIFAAVDKIVEEYNNSKQVGDAFGWIGWPFPPLSVDRGVSFTRSTCISILIEYLLMLNALQKQQQILQQQQSLGGGPGSQNFSGSGNGGGEQINGTRGGIHGHRDLLVANLDAANQEIALLRRRIAQLEGSLSSNTLSSQSATMVEMQRQLEEMKTRLIFKDQELEDLRRRHSHEQPLQPQPQPQPQPPSVPPTVPPRANSMPKPSKPGLRIFSPQMAVLLAMEKKNDNIAEDVSLPLTRLWSICPADLTVLKSWMVSLEIPVDSDCSWSTLTTRIINAVQGHHPSDDQDLEKIGAAISVLRHLLHIHQDPSMIERGLVDRIVNLIIRLTSVAIILKNALAELTFSLASVAQSPGSKCHLLPLLKSGSLVPEVPQVKGNPAGTSVISIAALRAIRCMLECGEIVKEVAENLVQHRLVDTVNEPPVQRGRLDMDVEIEMDKDKDKDLDKEMDGDHENVSENEQKRPLQNAETQNGECSKKRSWAARVLDMLLDGLQLPYKPYTDNHDTDETELARVSLSTLALLLSGVSKASPTLLLYLLQRPVGLAVRLVLLAEASIAYRGGGPLEKLLLMATSPSPRGIRLAQESLTLLRGILLTPSSVAPMSTAAENDLLLSPPTTKRVIAATARLCRLPLTTTATAATTTTAGLPIAPWAHAIGTSSRAASLAPNQDDATSVFPASSHEDVVYLAKTLQRRLCDRMKNG